MRCLENSARAAQVRSGWRPAWGFRGLRLLDPPAGRPRDPDRLRADLPLDHLPPRRPAQLTERSSRRSSSGRTYKVVGTPEEADTILDGTINFADKNLVVENPFNLPRAAQR